jgi:transposase
MSGSEDARPDASREELLAEIESLRLECRAKDETIKALQERIKELEGRVRMNSTNSSKPPSSDGYTKPSPKSQRARSGKRPGGQQGHEGHNMRPPAEPDEVIRCIPDRCSGCQGLAGCISGQAFEVAESRYVVDAVMEVRVREYRAMRVKSCPMDGRRSVSNESCGQFPEGVRAHVQYGDSFAAVAGILNTYGAVSTSRASDLIRSMFGVSLSVGTVDSMVRRCAECVEESLEGVRDKIVECDVSNFDETGVRCGGKLMWVHSSSTPRFTYQTVSEKRGTEGMYDNGVLKDFRGIAVHDCWRPYWNFWRAKHAVCCAHLLRELTGVEEMEPGHEWPRRFKSLLLDMKSEKEAAQANGKDSLDAKRLQHFDDLYDEILQLADSECPPPPDPGVKRRGRRKLGKERALIERLRTLKGSVTLFAHDFRAPFDNNLAERDVRNLKTKVKVSGCFRTKEGARRHLQVMSYISTARKQGGNAFESLVTALSNHQDLS